MEQAIIQVYTGDGKGKTTAATGLMVRALGQGKTVLLVRFLKPVEQPSGELDILMAQPNFSLLAADLGGVYDRHAAVDFARDAQRLFDQVRGKLAVESYDLVVLDEFNNVLSKGYVPIADGVEFLRQRPEGTELVLTGRNAPQEILDLASLVTSMQKQKHPYDDGLPARRGIEY